jgi:hypothetical protein
MPSLAKQILSDQNAQRVLIVEIGYNDGAEKVWRLAQGDTWSTDPNENPPNEEFVPHLVRGLNVEASIDSGGTLGGVGDVDFGVFEVGNLNGRYDAFAAYTVDGRTAKAWVVGTLSNGTKVRYSDVYDEPVFSGVGVDRPKRGRSVVRVGVRGLLYRLDKLINPRSFSPPCLEFPGTSAGNVDFGDNFDASGSFTISAWFYCIDPSVTGQFLFQKDTGAAGWGVEVGTAGSGALRGYCREQSTVNTNSAASLILPSRWHHAAMSINTVAQTRILVLDGTTVATTSTLTGSPAGNAASFKIGVGFRGRISRVRIDSAAMTPVQIRAEMYLHALGTESNLTALPNLEEGSGATTADSKSGSVVVGTLGTGVTWSGTSEWCGDSLVGKRWPEVLGYAKDVPLIPVDTALGIWAAANGPLISVPVVKSNHNPLTLTTHYTVDRQRGLVTITGGTVGNYTADVVANIPFGGALAFDGVDDFGSHAVTCPAGAMTLEMLVRPRTTAATTRYCGGWRNGTGAGARFLVFDTFAINSLIVQVRNDAGTSFIARKAGLTQDRMYHTAGVLDPTAGELRLYVDGVLEATAAISGTWATVLNTFVLARMPDASANFQNCVLDEVRIWSVARTQEQIIEGMVQEITSGTGLVRRWGFSEGSGSTAADSVAAGSMALTGATWTYSRHSHADMMLGTLTGPAEYENSEIDLSTAASFIYACPGDAGWYVGDSPKSCRETWDEILKGAHSYLIASIDGATLEMGQIALPSGTPDDDADFEEWAFPLSAPPDIDEDEIAARPSLFVVQYCRNWAPLDKETVVNIATSDPTTFAYAISEWREVSEPGSASGEALILGSAFLRREDARAELARITPFYSTDRERIWFTFGKAGLVLRPNSEFRQTFRTGDGEPRLGMDTPGRCFRLLRLRKVHGRGATRVEALGLS